MLMLAAAFGWLVSQFVPGTPQDVAKRETPTGFAVTHDVPIEADEVAEVPLGEVAVLDDLTRGEKYELEASQYLQEEFSQMSDEKKRSLAEGEYWDYELAPFSAQVTGAHVLSEEAFAEWWPLYRESSLVEELYAPEDVRVVVAEVELTNLADAEQSPPVPVLRCAQFDEPENYLNGGMYTSQPAMEAMYGMRDDNGVVGLVGGYDRLQPGETRVVNYAYVVYRNTFADPAAIDGLQLADLAIAYGDYNPYRIVSLELGAASEV